MCCFHSTPIKSNLSAFVVPMSLLSRHFRWSRTSGVRSGRVRPRHVRRTTRADRSRRHTVWVGSDLKQSLRSGCSRGPNSEEGAGTLRPTLSGRDDWGVRIPRAPSPAPRLSTEEPGSVPTGLGFQGDEGILPKVFGERPRSRRPFYRAGIDTNPLPRSTSFYRKHFPEGPYIRHSVRLSPDVLTRSPDRPPSVVHPVGVEVTRRGGLDQTSVRSPYRHWLGEDRGVGVVGDYNPSVESEKVNECVRMVYINDSSICK